MGGSLFLCDRVAFETCFSYDMEDKFKNFFHDVGHTIAHPIDSFEESVADKVVAKIEGNQHPQ